MVLGSHVDLSAFTSSGGSGVDVLSSVVGSDKRDSLDIGVIADVIYGIFSSVNDIDNTGGDSRSGEHVDDEFGGVRNTLGRFADEGVTGGNSKRVHPERDHSGEVVGGDSSADTEGLSVGLDINSSRDVLHGLSLHERGEGASVLGDFVTTEDITHTVSNGLTMLPADSFSEFLLVDLEEILEQEHVSNSGGNRGHLPFLEGLVSVLSGFVEFGISSLRDTSENSLCEGTDLVGPDSGLGGNPLSVDVVLVFFNFTNGGESGHVEGGSEAASGKSFRCKHKFTRVFNIKL